MQNLAATEFELVGEEELELEDEFEDFLGSGEFGEDEFETEWEADGEWAHEDGEEFFGKLRKLGGGLARIARRVPWRGIIKRVAPMVGTAVGGPLGGVLGRAASSLLEGEFEDEDEFEDEYEYEDEFEDEAPLPVNPAAELMAAVASQARTDAEAEAMTGAATLLSIPPAERAELRAILPYLVRGTAVMTKMLRRHPQARVGVRAVPEIVRRTSHTLARQSNAGRPVTRKAAARAMVSQTRRVLGNPRTCVGAIQTNQRAATRAAQPGAATRARAR
jgi:hypothetical protein